MPVGILLLQLFEAIHTVYGHELTKKEVHEIPERTVWDLTFFCYFINYSQIRYPPSDTCIYVPGRKVRSYLIIFVKQYAYIASGVIAVEFVQRYVSFLCKIYRNRLQNNKVERG